MPLFFGRQQLLHLRYSLVPRANHHFPCSCDYLGDCGLMVCSNARRQRLCALPAMSYRSWILLMKSSLSVPDHTTYVIGQEPSALFQTNRCSVRQEPPGGAHSDPLTTSKNLKAAIMKHMRVFRLGAMFDLFIFGRIHASRCCV